MMSLVFTFWEGGGTNKSCSFCKHQEALLNKSQLAIIDYVYSLKSVRLAFKCKRLIEKSS
jgi:hypothetical protein